LTSFFETMMNQAPTIRVDGQQECRRNAVAATPIGVAQLA
jgi:hypothetical protein